MQAQIDATIAQINLSKEFLTNLCDGTFKLPFMGTGMNCLTFLQSSFVMVERTLDSEDPVDYPKTAATMLTLAHVYERLRDHFKADTRTLIMLQDLWPERLTPGYVSSMIVAARMNEKGTT